MRPVFVSAVLRGIKFTPESYASFIDLQDKLHHNLGRRRTLVSIGTHDLDTIEGPFLYDALPPEEIKFIALRQTKETDANELFDILREDIHLKPYLELIEDKPRYPVILDKNGVVLSLPPIINSEHSKITLDTKNVFIDMTATDYTKALMFLNVVVTSFSLYSEDKFTIEQVEITKPDGVKEVTPRIENQSVEAQLSYLNRMVGLNLSKEEIVGYLDKMGLDFLGDAEREGWIKLGIPMFRSDIMHQCDVAEDLGISYGYDNIVPVMPPVSTTGLQFGLNKMSERVRVEMVSAGYKECLNFALCSFDENTKALGVTEAPLQAVIGKFSSVSRIFLNFCDL